MTREELQYWLNSLIGSELVAFLQYEIASHNVEGTDYDICSSEFKKHADEERGHMNTLMDCAVERDIYVVEDLPELIRNANPIYEQMYGKTTAELVQFHFNAEESAIVTYKTFYNLIKDEDITLANVIKHLLDDEIEHRKDLKKINSSITNNGSILTKQEEIYSNFSKNTKLTDRIKKYRRGY